MRTILHCDINNCFASIEALRNPQLRGRPIAVCGDPRQRRGIVLAKSEAAKQCGVKTGDVLWEARKKCPDIIFVPAHYDVYVHYSNMIRKYYEELTYRVEPYGIDECWLDVTGDLKRHGVSGYMLGEEIRETVKQRFGLTISVGVSFNKVFAKLGSDYRKPDAVTEFRREDMCSRIWPLPASDLFGVGRATQKQLLRFGIQSIGDIARSNVPFLRSQLGMQGEQLWRYANGYDESEVTRPEELASRQSIGHGTTLPFDVTHDEMLWPVLLELATRVAHDLRREGFYARGLGLCVRDSRMCFHQYHYILSQRTNVSETLARIGYMLFIQRYGWHEPVHAITLTADHLEPINTPHQLELFAPSGIETGRTATIGLIEDAMMSLNTHFGSRILKRATTLHPIPEHPCGFGRPQATAQ